MSVFANTIAFSVRAALARGAGFLAFWVILIGFGPADLVVGLIAAAAATWTSLRLLPPQPGRMRLTALLSLIPHFLWKSVVAGVDVARRALDPRLPLRPGFIAYRVGFAPGPASQCVRRDHEPDAGHGALRRRGRGARLPLPRRRATGGGRAR